MVKKLTVLAALVVLIAATPAAAANISYVNGGMNYNTAALTGYQTFGDNMLGMVVTATIRGPQGELSALSAVWGVVDAGYGVEFGDNLFVWLNPGVDTFGGDWHVTYRSPATAAFTVASLAFNGGPGKTVFDRTNPSFGTDGSYQGRDMTGFSGYGGDILVQYLNPVGVAGLAPVGDIYRNVLFNFQTNGGLGTGDYTFQMDADNATTDIIPDNPVPEPTTMVLFGSGLLGLVRAARKRR